ncbi:MAG: UDP-N-acetylmuramoyl-tripeptide--D-alanyl-D-alanine ligase [Longimicrobiales bacterium]
MRWSMDTVREALALAAAGTPAGAMPGEPSGAEAVGEPGALAFTGIGTDTRTLQPGMLFVALKGERFDAHDFLAEAAEKGAIAAVVERVPEDAPTVLAYIEVPDSLVALGQLGRYRRRRLTARVCAITGTNGKTTTKDLARAVLSTCYRVHATAGNLNNQIGTPLTLLSVADDVDVIVAEVGTNAPGEIARLRDIVEPDAVIITNVAEGHLEGLGTLEGVLHEKTALLEALDAVHGFAVVGDTPAALAERSRRLASRVRVAGMSERADEDLRATAVRLNEDGAVRFDWRGREVALPYRGRHNALLALLALGLAESWDVDLDAAIAALARVEPQKMRNELHRYGSLRVIADCYNANPPSVRAAVDLLRSLPGEQRKVLILGTMKELGSESGALHREVAEEAAEAEFDLIVATGEFAAAFEPYRTRLGERLLVLDDAVTAFPAIAERLSGDETVLLKGSRGVALERLLPLLQAHFGGVDERDSAGSAAEAGGSGVAGKGKPASASSSQSATRRGRSARRSRSSSPVDRQGEDG